MSSIYEAALAALTHQPSGGFRLESLGADQLKDRLQGAEPPVSALDLQPLLKLIAVLEAEPESQGAAKGLVQVLQASPRAFTALSTAKAHRVNRGRVARRRLSTFEGRIARNNVPTYDAPAPQGTLRGRNLMRPIDSAEVKARR